MFRASWPSTFTLLLVACGSGADGEPPPSSVGGASSGGTAAASGSSSGSGGSLPASSGGTTGSGGVPSSGGTSTSGSTPGNGNTTSTGGTPDAGGVGAGGASAGGTSGSGGANTGGGASIALPDGVTDLFPLPGATGVCPDPALRLTFAGAPKLGTSGSVQVLQDDGTSGTLVTSVDFSATTISDTIGGQKFTLPRQVYVDGNEVVVVLKSRALTYGKRYRVVVSGGAITGPGNAPFSLPAAANWTFATALAPPASAANLTVAANGGGEFCSPQGALDFAPGTAPSRIDVQRGTYHGVVYFSGKRGITLHGADRKGVVLSGTNNNNLNPSTKGRALFGADAATDLVIENLTIRNLTPQGGSQAEALRLQTCDRCIVRNADISSLQDTLLWSGRLYAKDCFIAGNVDFVWGTGAAYFDSCEIKTVGRSGYIVQARNAPGAYGYVFVDSRITSDPGITGSTLGRVDVSAYPGSHVAYIDCVLGEHISRAGWTLTGGTPSSSLRFWEYGSKTASGSPVDTGGRLGGSTRITAQQAASMRSKAAVLGGWEP